MKTLRADDLPVEIDQMLAELTAVVNGRDMRAGVSALATLFVRGVMMRRMAEDSPKLRDWIRGVGDLFHLLADCRTSEMVQIAENATLAKDEAS